MERIAVGLCTPFSIIGLVVALQTVRSSKGSLNGYQALSALFVLATILMGLPALLWKTRFRLAAEGVATIALAVASALAGFSIGFTFVPLLVLMIWICVQHLRDVDKSRGIEHQPSG